MGGRKHEHDVKRLILLHIEEVTFFREALGDWRWFAIVEQKKIGTALIVFS